MTTEKLEARIRYAKQAIAEVNDALVSLEEQRAVKQLRLDVWHQNTLARLTRTKACLSTKAHHLAATKRAKQRNRHSVPGIDKLVSVVEMAQPTNVKPA